MPAAAATATRAGATISFGKDDLNLAMFYETIDMAMAVSRIFSARREPEAQVLQSDRRARPPRLERRRLGA